MHAFIEDPCVLRDPSSPFIWSSITAFSSSVLSCLFSLSRALSACLPTASLIYVCVYVCLRVRRRERMSGSSHFMVQTSGVIYIFYVLAHTNSAQLPPTYLSCFICFLALYLLVFSQSSVSSWFTVDCFYSYTCFAYIEFDFQSAYL